MGCVVVFVAIGLAVGGAWGGYGVAGIGGLCAFFTAANVLFALTPGSLEERPRESYVLSQWWTATLLGTLAALIVWLSSG